MQREMEEPAWVQDSRSTFNILDHTNRHESGNQDPRAGRRGLVGRLGCGGGGQVASGVVLSVVRGSVTLPNPDGTTQIDVRISYNPPAGALGHAVAQLFGVDPRQAMHEDLVRLKSLLEDGRTSSSEGTAELGAEGSLD